MAVIFTGSERNADPSVRIAIPQVTESLMYHIQERRLHQVLDVIARNPAGVSQELFLVSEGQAQATLQSFHHQGDLTLILDQLYNGRIKFLGGQVDFLTRRGVFALDENPIHVVLLNGLDERDFPLEHYDPEKTIPAYTLFHIGDIPPESAVGFRVDMNATPPSNAFPAHGTKDFFIDGAVRTMNRIEYENIHRMVDPNGASEYFRRNVKPNIITPGAHDVVIPRNRLFGDELVVRCDESAQALSYFHEENPLSRKVYWFATQDQSFHLAATVVRNSQYAKH
ncbi:MAG: hypothetical protein KKC75_01295 [Nanoarchaeota archaeon]|nr:hypothetical protein [Nanoarchaeota archaeon]MBU1004410.1 hypothetical protein [Nanoarchaeota archaeon]MBU1946703.1 hypothetical protein [Nanoarchaeota archaeon]